MRPARRSTSKQPEASFEQTRARAKAVLVAASQGEVKPVYLIAGADSLQRERCLRNLVKRLLPEEFHATSLVKVDGEKATPGQVAGELESRGFNFDDAPRRVVLVRDARFLLPPKPKPRAGAKADEDEAGGAGGVPDDETPAPEAPAEPDDFDFRPLMRCLQSPGWADRCLLLEVRGTPRKGELLETISQLGTVLEFAPVANAEDARALLTSRLPPHVTLTKRAVDELTARCGFDSQRLRHEIDKLVAYVGDDDEINEDDVRAMVAATAELEPWPLIDAVSARQPRHAVDELNKLLDQGDSPFAIHGSLVRTIRLLLQARHLWDLGLVDRGLLRWGFATAIHAKGSDGESTFDRWRRAMDGLLPADDRHALLKQKPYPLQKALVAAQHLSTPALAAALERLLQADLALKSSHLPPEQEMELLVTDLCVRIEAGATVPLETLLEP